MTKNVEFIKKSFASPCHKCSGTGYLIGPGIKRKDALKNPCKVCNGTGNWYEDDYHLIATMPNGQKIAFQCESFQ